MPRSMQTLPQGYTQVFEIDLAVNKKLAIVLNLAGLGVLIITLWLLALFAGWVHPELSGTTFSITLGLPELVLLLALVLLVVVNMIVHELIHGAFFWLFTRSRPVFGLTLAYAYAAAPDWYIPMGQYWIIGLAPLLLIGAAGLWVMAFSPQAWWLPAAVMVGFNTGGACGDMWIIYRLMRTSPSCLVRDTGHSIHFYQPEKMPGKDH